MKARFLPNDYAHKLFQSYQKCSQRKRPVDEYTEEFYRLVSRVNLPETEAQQVSRYLSGLDVEIKEELHLYPIQTVTEAVSLAQRIELHPKMGTKTPVEAKRTKLILEVTPAELSVTPHSYQPPQLPKVPTIDASHQER
ncbi:hypothetical protein MKW92_030751 [Papaver armeniacum]|nr:hypothetical protein MKW92_030751 [Papaver armeniacum]